MAILNIGTWMFLRRGAASSQGHLLFQLGTDIAALSGLLVLTGGAWNPMVPILFVHTVLGALLLEGRLEPRVHRVARLVPGSHPSLLAHPGKPGGQPPSRGAVVPQRQLVVALAFWMLTAWLGRTPDRPRESLRLSARAQDARRSPARRWRPSQPACRTSSRRL